MRKLDLSNNKITDIPKEISNLKYLETLNLSGNKIRHVLAKVFELPQLKILILSNNEIINIPKQVVNFQNLKILHLANNKLKNIPAEVTALDQLEELNLTGNQIGFLPPLSGSYKNLKTLWVAHNPLTLLTSHTLLAAVPRLEKLYCFSPRMENKVMCIDPLIQAASGMIGNSLPWLKRRAAEAKVIKKKSDPKSTEPKPKKVTKEPAIFISYSHKDDGYLDRLQVHLKGLQRLRPELKLVVWDDKIIKSSHDWSGEIKQALDRATDAIFLVSPDFLASDFIMESELPHLLQAASNQGVRLHSIILKPCHFHLSPLAKFKASNSPSQTMIELNEGAQERIYVELCTDIAYFIENPSS